MQVLWPMGSTDGVLLRLVPERAAILHSRERAPFILFVETVPLQYAGAKASSHAAMHHGGAEACDDNKMPSIRFLRTPRGSSTAYESKAENRVAHGDPQGHIEIAGGSSRSPQTPVSTVSSKKNASTKELKNEASASVFKQRTHAAKRCVIKSTPQRQKNAIATGWEPSSQSLHTFATPKD